MNGGVTGPCVLLTLMSQQMFTWICYKCLSFQTDNVMQVPEFNNLFQEEALRLSSLIGCNIARTAGFIIGGLEDGQECRRHAKSRPLNIRIFIRICENLVYAEHIPDYIVC